MNILIPDTWLRDIIETNAKPDDIEKALSLHAFSVEKTTRCDDGDFVYEIEITPNRGDALSVLGIARELMAILPKKGFSAKWKNKTAEKFTNSSDDTLDVVIEKKDLVPRFSAVVLKDIKIKPSSELVKSRLEKVGIRPINAVVDMTNYLMVETGQPMHVFDYDKIHGHKMIVRESKKGERLTTLDGIERTLPADVIVIEDSDNRIIDLCGIMGCENSEVDENTNKVLFFVQIYDPVRIRKASMNLGHRTDAALRFEKGVDPEGVLPGLYAGVKMLQDQIGVGVSSNLIDIVNKKFLSPEVALDYEKISKIAGVPIEKEVIEQSLENLGFKVSGNNVRVPSWRAGDIEIDEDLAEEVIRIYGYYNLPDNLLTGEIPLKKEDRVFYWEDKAKNFLKYNGFYECYTNSATTEDLAGDKALHISNPLSQDLSHLRTSLVPQLVEVLNTNSMSPVKGFFELSAVYLPTKNDLPKQPMNLAIVTKTLSYSAFKGVIEALLSDMGITENAHFTIKSGLGGVFSVEVCFDDLSVCASSIKSYSTVSKYNSIKEDLTLLVSNDSDYQDIKSLILDCDSRISKVDFKDFYENSLTISIEYLDKDKQLSSTETQDIRSKVFKKLKDSLNVTLKS